MKKFAILLGCVLVGAVLIAYAGQVSANPAADVTVDPSMLAAFKPLSASFEKAENPPNEAKIELGRMLYYDTRFSKNHDLSCNSCHKLSAWGVDNKPTSPGHKGQLGARNSPTVYNAAGAFVQFWDGREPDVEAQAKGPVLNPVEMAIPDSKVVLSVIDSIPQYVELFKKAFPNDKTPVTYDNFGNAIGAFERKLVTPSRWDKFLAGDKTALTNEEKVGFNTFVQTGCTMCHNGELIGGNVFQKAGLVKPWPNTEDFGRFGVTKAEGDKYLFKVPTLRNIEKTGPYFHDGKTATLEEAVRMMGEYQLGKALPEEDVTAIVAWLKSLTGDLPTAYIAEPKLPASTAQTPKPDPA